MARWSQKGKSTNFNYYHLDEPTVLPSVGIFVTVIIILIWIWNFRAEDAKEKFYKLHEALVINMENEQVLMKKARALQKELSNELLKLEKT